MFLPPYFKIKEKYLSVSRSTVKDEYNLEDAPRPIKGFIRVAQTEDSSELRHDKTYALYGENSSGRRHIIPAKYDAEQEKFLTKGIFTYDPSGRKIRIRETSKYLDDCELTPKKVSKDRFDEVEELLESD